MAAMPPPAGRTRPATPTRQARPQQPHRPRRVRLPILALILVLFAALVPSALADDSGGGDQPPPESSGEASGEASGTPARAEQPQPATEQASAGVALEDATGGGATGGGATGGASSGSGGSRRSPPGPNEVNWRLDSVEWDVDYLETVPEETVPEETVPEETVPEETVREETVREVPETDGDGGTPEQVDPAYDRKLREQAAKQLADLEPHVTSGTAQHRRLNELKGRLDALERKLAGQNPMSMVRVEAPGTPGRQASQGRPALPGPAGFAGDGTALAGAGPDPFIAAREQTARVPLLLQVAIGTLAVGGAIITRLLCGAACAAGTVPVVLKGLAPPVSTPG
jgi:hypothetical protein